MSWQSKKASRRPYNNFALSPCFTTRLQWRVEYHKVSHPWAGHFFARLSFGVGHLMIFTMVEARGLRRVEQFHWLGWLEKGVGQRSAGWDTYGTLHCMYILESNKIATTCGLFALFTALSGYQETSTTLFRYEYHHMHFHCVAHGPTFDPIHLQL